MGFTMVSKVDDNVAIEKLNLEDPDAHVLGCFVSGQMVSRSQKFDEQAKTILSRLNSTKPGLLANDSLYFDSTKPKASTHIGTEFVKIVAEDEDYWLPIMFFVDCARAINQKLTYIQQYAEGEFDDRVTFAYVPVEITVKENAVLNAYYNVEFEGVIRRQKRGNGTLTIYHDYSRYELRGGKHNQYFYCADGSRYVDDLLHYKENCCRSRAEMVVDQHGVIRLHIRPHDKDKGLLHHSNHSSGGWVSNLEVLDFASFLKARKNAEIAAKGYVEETINTDANGKEFIEHDGCKYIRTHHWKCQRRHDRKQCTRFLDVIEIEGTKCKVVLRERVAKRSHSEDSTQPEPSTIGKKSVSLKKLFFM